MDDEPEAAVPEGQPIDETAPAPSDAPPDEAAPDAKTAVASESPVQTVIDKLWAEYWPENTGAGHPAPYLSGAWHHAHAAGEDLKARLGALAKGE